MTTSSNIPKEELSFPDEKFIAGVYFNQLTKVLDGEMDSKQVTLLFAKQMASKYFMTILLTLSEIDRLCVEMQSVLGEFPGRNLGFAKLLTAEHLAMAMKLYVITWSTVLDILGQLINVVFDLGMADRDVRARLVLNNRHVRSSRIPEILKEYEKKQLIKDMRSKRNDLVHRGRIPDDDVAQMFRDRNTINSRRYSLLGKELISEDEYKKQLSLLQGKLSALAKEKQELWGKHYQQTIAMLSEVAAELAVKTIDLCKKQAL